MEQAFPSKTLLRAECLTARERIAPDYAKTAGIELARRIVERIPRQADIVAGYSAVRGEIDISEALAQLSERGHTLALPVIVKSPSPLEGEGRVGGGATDSAPSLLSDPSPNPSLKGRGNILIFRRWRLGHPLVAGHFNIAVPPESEPVVIPDAVIVPLVAFDGAGHRLGYGAGFYDATIRALRQAKKNVTILGAAFAIQQRDSIPFEAHDETLDAIATENEIISIT